MGCYGEAVVERAFEAGQRPLQLLAAAIVSERRI